MLEEAVKKTLGAALIEDRAFCDITSEACIPAVGVARGDLILKQSGRVAGLIFLPWLIEAHDPSLKLLLHVAEGSEYAAGTKLATLQGNPRSILSLERTALNLIQHTSGIATLTASFVQAVNGHRCDILDTRKTLPGMRAIQKYAVRMGGGKNHRFDLEERYLIKNNHLALEPSIRKAIEKARALKAALIEIEVENLEMLKEALEAGADLILLDNMAPETVKEAVSMTQKRAYLEASGGISLQNVSAYAATGVDGISIGALTHSAPAIDISMRISWTL